MARRRRNHEEPENHERWLISYADFITLLMAFFVVMYSVSSVNEGKFRVLASSLNAAFRSTQTSMQPIQIGQLARSPLASPADFIQSPMAIDLSRMPTAPLVQEDDTGPDESDEEVKDDAEAADKRKQAEQESIDMQQELIEQQKREFQEMSEAVEQQMRPLIDEGLIKVRRHDLWIEIEMNTSILFLSGSATLASQASPVLRELAATLKTYPNRIHVEGFTDNVPINTRVFPSNWELSAARAASVVHLFTGAGIHPDRMASIGYGEYRPVADNATPEGRRKNRRVNVVVLADMTRDKNETGRQPEVLREELEFLEQIEAPPAASEEPVVAPAKTAPVLPTPQPAVEPDAPLDVFEEPVMAPAETAPAPPSPQPAVEPEAPRKPPALDEWGALDDDVFDHGQAALAAMACQHVSPATGWGAT